jgi:hypothetical protein
MGWCRFGYETGVGVVDAAGSVALVEIASERNSRQCDN